MAATKVLVDVSKAGKAGGKARAENLTAEELSAAGRNAVQARWDAYYAAHPEKLRAREEREAKKGIKRGRPAAKKVGKKGK